MFLSGNNSLQKWCLSKQDVDLGKNRCCEWCHGFTVVVRDDTLQERNGSFNLALGQESHNTNHGKTSVVDFLLQAVCLGFVGSALVPSERIVKVEGASRNDTSIEIGEITGLSSSHVVGSCDLTVLR